MLSPRRMTKLNRDFAWLLITTDARSYSSLSPVPISPIAANRTEFFRSGRVMVWAASEVSVTPASTTNTHALYRKRMGHEIHDQVRVDVTDHEEMFDPAILEVVWQLRQQRQQQGIKGRERILGREELIDLGIKRRQTVLLVLVRCLLPAHFDAV